jgi:tRNA(adenine34) deaminase
VATKKSAAAKKKSAGDRGSSSKKRWVRKVTTDSTHPPKDLFTKSAPVIARSLASKKVSPKGPGSGMRMLTYFINRAGKGLSASRRRTLERAKELLHDRIEKEKGSEKAKAA